jgi:hypothetical protein
VATPFVQGRLLEKDLGCVIETKCAISGRPIVFELDSEFRYGVRPPAEKPVFMIPMIDIRMFMIPMIDIRNLDAPCIVDDF